MKRSVLLLITLGLFFLIGCNDKNNEPSIQTSLNIPKGTSMPSSDDTKESSDMTQSELSSDDTKESSDMTQLELDSEEEIYSFSEIDKTLGPDSFSINNLIETCGEPIQVFGTIISMSSGHFGIIADFDGITFELVANHDESLSFDTEDNFNNAEESMLKYELTNSDKMVLIRPFSTTITNNKWNLPRNIKIGDNKQKVITAYNNDKGHEWNYEDQLRISYSYRPDIIEEYTSDEVFNLESQTGDVTYCFDNDSLVEVDISWYNAYLAFD